MAIEQNITPYSQYFTGEDKSLPFTIYGADQATAQNITGWSLSYMVKEDPEDDDADAVITKTTDDGISITDAAEGQGSVALSDDDIEDLDPDTKYHHELKRTDPGLETVLIYGRFQLGQAVHR